MRKMRKMNRRKKSKKEEEEEKKGELLLGLYIICFTDKEAEAQILSELPNII